MNNEWETYLFDPGTPETRSWVRPKSVTTTLVEDWENLEITKTEYGYFNTEDRENDFGLTYSVTYRGYIGPATGNNEDPNDDRMTKHWYNCLPVLWPKDGPPGQQLRQELPQLGDLGRLGHQLQPEPVRGDGGLRVEVGGDQGDLRPRA